MPKKRKAKKRGPGRPRKKTRRGRPPKQKENYNSSTSADAPVEATPAAPQMASPPAPEEAHSSSGSNASFSGS